VPPPGIPGPFALEDAAGLEALLVDAGLDDVSVGEVPVPMRVDSFEEWWSRTTALAGPIAKMLARLPDDATQALQARAREAVRPYESAGGLEFPGVSLVASARVAD
jgi:enediyne biosynthesis protein CalE5